MFRAGTGPTMARSFFSSRHSAGRAALAATAAVFALAPGVRPQDTEDLAIRVWAAIHGDPALGFRHGIVQPPHDDPRGRAPRCPVCGDELAEVALGRSGGRRIEGPLTYTAHVCEDDGLFFVRTRGVMTAGDAGPFALPAAGVRPARRALPWGATLLANEPVAVPAGWAPNAVRSADGSLVVGGGHGSAIQVWDGERFVFEDDGPMGVLALALSDDGTRIALARSMSPVRVASLRTGRVLGTVPVGRANVTHVAFDPAGERVLLAVVQGGTGPLELRLANAAGRGGSRELLRIDEDVRHTVWLPRAQRVLVSTYRGLLRSVSLADGAVHWQTELGFAPEQLVASPDHSRMLATGEGGRRATLLDSLAGTEVRAIRVDSLYEHDRGVGSAVAWEASGGRFAWTLADGRLALAPTGPADELLLGLGAVDLKMPGPMRLRFSADGAQLVTARLDGERMAWDLARFVPRR